MLGGFEDEFDHDELLELHNDEKDKKRRIDLTFSRKIAITTRLYSCRSLNNRAMLNFQSRLLKLLNQSVKSAS